MIKLSKTNGGITGIQPKPVVNYIFVHLLCNWVLLKARINYSTLWETNFRTTTNYVDRMKIVEVSMTRFILYQRALWKMGKIKQNALKTSIMCCTKSKVCNF